MGCWFSFPKLDNTDVRSDGARATQRNQGTQKHTHTRLWSRYWGFWMAAGVIFDSDIFN